MTLIIRYPKHSCARCNCHIRKLYKCKGVKLCGACKAVVEG